MSDLNKLLGPVTLVQLLEILQEMGIVMSSLPDSPVLKPAPAPAPACAAPVSEPAPLPESILSPAPSAPAPTAPSRPNEAVFAGLLLALSQMGINNANATPLATFSSALSTLASGSHCQALAATAHFEGGGVDVSISPAPILPVSLFAGGLNKGKGKETAPLPEGDAPSGFMCARCRKHILPHPSEDLWYIVTIGLEVGVFQGWQSVLPFVSGVSGACYKKHLSKEAAHIAFAKALAASKVFQV
ncbi:hypothetical protein EST38_g6846 [Candolleomyces aberdarensis]|uniref:Ribonuclease H1 N-terminal domain-containing protein n=1 Tax=Candolleomyces aberdarensis TaxID=2316362 RepID=A0A4Q2DIK6_9AGAR|nr:hypothetical protein EST38_g6846 [Candolleomyces aberdarensis]